MREWIREQPASPETAPSDWYWYWDDKDREPCVIELWPKRDIVRYRGWWGPRVEPLKRPPKLKGRG